MIKILWPIDPTAPKDTFEKMIDSSVSVFNELRARSEIKVLPVHLLASENWDRYRTSSLSELNERRAEVESEIERLIEKRGLSFCEKPEVFLRFHKVGQPGFHPIVEKAKQFGADFILSTPHGHKGFSRLISPSFTENLLGHTPVPILSASIHAMNIPWEKVVFGTDFSPESRLGFERLVEFASKLKISVTLFVQNTNSEDEAGLRAELSAWKKWAEKQGVSCDTELESAKRPNVLRSLLAIASAKKGVLLAIGTRLDRLNPNRNSIAKGLIQEACCPVWVDHRPVSTWERMATTSIG